MRMYVYRDTEKGRTQGVRWYEWQIYKSSSSSGRGTASAYRDDISTISDYYECDGAYLCQLLLVLLHESGVNLDLSGCKSGSSDELQRGVTVMNIILA